MIKEALSYLNERFLAAKAIARINHLSECDSRHEYYDVGGVLTPVELPPEDRSHSVRTVDDLILAAKRWGVPEATTIFIGTGSVTVLIDDADRLETVRLDLPLHPQFKFLEGCEEKSLADQPTFLKSLRIHLPGIERRDELISRVRSIKWKSSTDGYSEFSQGRESLGKSVEAEIIGASEIPEAIVVNTPVFALADLDMKVGILCDLEVVATSQRFRFCPLADELRSKREIVLDVLKKTIVKSLPKATVLFGSP